MLTTIYIENHAADEGAGECDREDDGDLEQGSL
jgi:hypothetical protein